MAVGSPRLRPGTPDDAPACGRSCYEAFRTLAEHHRFPPEFRSPEHAAETLGRLLAHPRSSACFAQVRVLHAPQVGRVQVPSRGPGLEAHAFGLVPRHEEPSRRDDLMSEDRWSAVQDDQVDISTRGTLELDREPIEIQRIGARFEQHRDVKVTGRAYLLTRRGAEQVRESHVATAFQELPARFDACHAAGIARAWYAVCSSRVGSPRP